MADTALVLGDVHLGDHCNVWYGAVVRGDVNYIRIGAFTNIQDGAVVHASSRPAHPTIIGDSVTVGHRAVIHACTIESTCMIGIGAVVLDGATVGQECIVAAGSLVPPGKCFPSRSLICGSPARVKRPLEPGEIEEIRSLSRRYVKLARKHVASM